MQLLAKVHNKEWKTVDKVASNKNESKQRIIRSFIGTHQICKTLSLIVHSADIDDKKGINSIIASFKNYLPPIKGLPLMTA